jgi:hypothetical protein
MSEVWFGSHGARRSREQGNSRTIKKQSQSCRLKKSGFRVWTSGRLVNIYEMEMTFMYVFTLGIFFELEGIFGRVKVPSSPYKRGREGTCKWIHNFGSLSILWEILSLLPRYCCVWTSLLCSLSFVFGDRTRIFGYPQQTWSISHTQDVQSRRLAAPHMHACCQAADDAGQWSLITSSLWIPFCRPDDDDGRSSWPVQ